jgi:hypothetical protein
MVLPVYAGIEYILTPGFCKCKIERTLDYDYSIVVENDNISGVALQRGV